MVITDMLVCRWFALFLLIFVLGADATNENDLQQTASFKGEYVAKFNFPTEAAEAVINDLIDREPYQYVLVAQAFPLAMTHFRRELQATGFNGQQLPLGI